ncbi:MAG: 6-phosphofructokinase [Candidatus Omnitrophica bacterium]|nr:6-phosphofructokinase [Candidatus Omnitrophota bacterium]MCM8806949.1 6-phosphofructokinase [Candidatus Omnitrophota bacterium]
MKKIGVITTGGDAPGMNAAIRSVVRTAIFYNIEVVGIVEGFKGLYEKKFISLNSRSVSGIINQGGTILKTKRFYEFKNKQVRETSYQNLKNENIEGLVVIGGNGSAVGAYLLYSEFNFPVVHIPASIDNDVYGTDYTIGFDTAVNTAIDAIDKIRDTATSHERTFIIEVMGRDCGNLALEVGIVCGAEIVIIPEIKFEIDKIVEEIKEEEKKGKKSCIIVLAEGAGKAEDLTKILKEKLPDREIRYTVLGYIQRGGKPTYLTRKLATIFGSKAVELLISGQYGYMIGLKGEEIIYVPLVEVVNNKKLPKFEYLDIIQKMSI